jgi:hypothetical protein
MQIITVPCIILERLVKVSNVHLVALYFRKFTKISSDFPLLKLHCFIEIQNPSNPYFTFSRRNVKQCLPLYSTVSNIIRYTATFAFFEALWEVRSAFSFTRSSNSCTGGYHSLFCESWVRSPKFLGGNGAWSEQ